MRKKASPKATFPIAVLAIITLFTGCTANRQYQQAWPASQVEVRKGDLRSPQKLAVIEFDEHGDLWDTKQFRAALKLIRTTPKPLVVTYIHGWRHNARPSDLDLVQFSGLIGQLNGIKPNGHTAIGVYIGWRGASVNEVAGPLASVPALLSFWNRKAATDRMADLPLGSVLNQVSSAAWNNKAHGAGRSVMVGHSFGGRILEKVAGMSTSSQSGTLSTVNPLADLLVLINPASESLTARKFKISMQGWKKDYPLVVAVGASDDGATGAAWPIGYALSPQPLTRAYRTGVGNEGQDSYLKVTVTNDPRQITEQLTLDAASGSPRPSPSETLAVNLMGDRRDRTIWIRTNGAASDPSPYILEKVDSRRVKGADHVIGSDAYWTMQVPKEVLSGHSGNRASGGVLSVPMTDLITGIFGKSKLDQRPVGAPEIQVVQGQSAPQLPPSSVPVEVPDQAAPNNAEAQRKETAQERPGLRIREKT